MWKDWQSRPAFTPAELHCQLLKRPQHEKAEKYRGGNSLYFENVLVTLLVLHAQARSWRVEISL
jgi:hypothetical protein